jgi:uncharacterized protein YecT (DUF1311 family)
LRILLAELSLALVALPIVAQTAAPTSHPHKVLTPEQVAYQQARKNYNTQLDKLRATAIAAYSAEMAREKAPECPNANSTYDINMCLSHEIDLTDANYKAFASSLRAMLALPEPSISGESTPYVGPTGPAATPATNTAAFDAAETAWDAYARAQCDVVDTYWRSGTIVNAMVGECNLRLARARMHELDFAYDNLLRPH